VITQEYQSVTDVVSVGLIQLGHDARHASMNSAAVELTGYSCGELSAEELHLLFHDSNETCSEGCDFLGMTANGTTIRGKRVQMRRKDGSWVPVRLSVHPLQGSGESRGALLELSDDTALLRAERARELFTAALGHDLRNPLNTIVLGCNLLANARLETPYKNTLQRMVNGTNRMERLIQQTMFLAQSLAQSVAIERIAMDLGAACNALTDELRARTPTRTITRAGDESSMGTWDPDRLNQVLDNLLVNAIRHGDGEVTLTLEDRADQALLKVHNWGLPIASEARNSLFDPFRRAGKRSGGVGLGLYIVDQIVRAHGGEVEFSSDEMEGTTFVVRLPKAPPAS